MMLFKTFLAVALSLSLSSALAHGDEDHGQPPTLPGSALSLPNTASQSADFELVAQLNGNNLTVYLDRFADNQPVLKASIEVQSDAFTARLQEIAPGTYQASAAALNTPGEHSLVFTVLAGEQSDLLDAVLNVSATQGHAHPASVSLRWWSLGGGLLLVLFCGGLLLRRRLAHRSITRGAPV